MSAKTSRPRRPHEYDENAKEEKADLEIDDVLGILGYFYTFLIYVAYGTMLVSGYLRMFIARTLMILGLKKDPLAVPKGYAPLYKRSEYFWLTNFYQRLRDGFARPVPCVAGARFQIMERVSDDGNVTYRFTGKNIDALNVSSYNYLGFAENSGPVIDSVVNSMDRYSFAAASPRQEGGNLEIIQELERTIAEFVGQPAAIVYGMGFATNSTTIPVLCGGKGTLIISDTLNHASIVTGSRDAPGAKILVFKHNDPADLELVLKNAIIEGQPRTHRDWKKIIVIVEGIYSMEGEICRLPEIVALKKKYKTYLYVDEAHSIGALGKTGRGVCEHWGVNPRDIDILMGTFTKAFGSVGGYISGNPDLIEYLKFRSFGTIYSTSMSPACAQQALSALRVIMGKDGTTDGLRRLKALHENSNYFRRRLLEEGFHVFGDKDSPVVLLMLYNPAMMISLSRRLLQHGIAIVIVGFPVTRLLLSRVRFCLSSGHTIEELEKAVQIISREGERLGLKYRKYAGKV